MNFPSTILPQTNDPKENQKAVLDLLDKINKTWDQIASAIAALPAAKVYAPFPQSAAGVGQFVPYNDVALDALSLPAGGMWIYEIKAFVAVNGTWNSPNSKAGGPTAGGTVLNSSTGTYYWTGWAYRVA